MFGGPTFAGVGPVEAGEKWTMTGTLCGGDFPQVKTTDEPLVPVVEAFFRANEDATVADRLFFTVSVDSGRLPR